MSLKQHLLASLRAPSYIPLTIGELCDALELTQEGQRELRKLLKSLVTEGSLAQVKGKRYMLSKEADLISGIIRFKKSGAALLIPDDDPENIIEIRAEDTSTALNKDHILVRLKQTPTQHSSKAKRGKSEPVKQQGKVIKILKRERTSFSGTLRKSRSIFYVIPDDPHLPYDILVEDPKRSALKPQLDDKVVVKLSEWEQRHRGPFGEISEVLGETHTPYAEYQAILHKYELSPEFPASIERFVQKLPKTVLKKDLKNRLDCRDLFTLTIDPTDAKDFDDALSVEHLDNGDISIGIHIADVSAYVTPKSILDKEAQKRGNSTYLVGTVIPMLPHVLSSGLCSLVEAEDRLTKAVFLIFGPNGNLKRTEFANTVIHSDKRLTYIQAYAFLKEKDIHKIKKMPAPPAHQTGFAGRSLKELSNKELTKIQDTIQTLWKIASKLRKNRMHKGSLDLDMPESKIYVDEEGYADRIERIENDESHQLIEEFMLLANESVAKKIFDANLPFISRVHDSPDPEKLNELRETLLSFGLEIGDLTARKTVNQFLKKIKTHPQGHTLKIHFLRSLKQACYRAEADGHYGLNKVFYAHFTSPIRRFSDLIVHRIFDFYLAKTGGSTAPKSKPFIYSKAEQVSLAEHLSHSERNSTDAERESKKIKLLEFFDREVLKKKKNHFDAIITDLKNHGIFVELIDSMAFGFIPNSSMRHDFFTLSADGTSLRGKRSGKKYILGQTIQVKVKAVDRFKRQIDFQMAVDKW